jgi:Lipocalin-like domain
VLNVDGDLTIDRADIRIIAGCIAILLGLSCLRSSSCEAGPQREGRRSAAERQQLIGAWRLAAIEYSGPRGETVDPYYQAGSSGIIIYDSSGWMSVQITAQNRRKWEVPAVRVPRAVEEADAALKAEAFDTYYSYYGTWDYDAATSVVTHHVKSSIIPAETGLDYAQTVTLESGHLIFTVRSGKPGTETVRKKIWERLPYVTNTRTTR